MQTFLLIAAALVIAGQQLYIRWVGNNTDSLAKVIRKQADVIYKGQQVVGEYMQQVERQSVQIGQKVKLIDAYEKILEENNLLPGLSN